MYDEAVRRKPRSLVFVPDHFKTEGMCEGAVEKNQYTLRDVPLHFRTQEMCIKAVEKYLYPLKFVSEHLKSKEMCDKAVRIGPTHWNLSLTVLRQKRRVTRQCAGNKKP